MLIACFQYRLDKLATTGLPLWITEMTLENSDENVRANWFENALTTYFSHPSVEGVILWGFWDEFVNPNAALVNGNYLYVSILREGLLSATANVCNLTVRIRTPEKYDVFAQRYQSQTITPKFQKHC